MCPYVYEDEYATQNTEIYNAEQRREKQEGKRRAREAREEQKNKIKTERQQERNDFRALILSIMSFFFFFSAASARPRRGHKT